MSGSDPAGPRVSLRRVVILLLFGASACMALTEPGRWAAWRLLPHRAPISSAPLALRAMPPDARFAFDVDCAFAALRADGEPGSGLAPTDERLIERLAPIGRWTDCVVFELGSRPADIEANGWRDRELCVAIANAGPLRSPAQREDYTESGWRSWIVLLLDDQGRRVASSCVSALRPGCTLCDDDSQPLAVQPDTSLTNAMPMVRSFHRDAQGSIVVR